MDQDLEHLKLLSIFHYVLAGMVGFFSLFPLIHVTLGLLMVAGALPDSGGDAVGRIVGWVFVAIGSILILLGETFAVCLFLAGRALARHRRYTFCMVVAAVSCLAMPLGTILGVFTIIVLQKASVRSLFAPGPVT